MWWSDWWGGYGPMPWMFFWPVMMIIFVVLCVAMMRGGMTDRERGAHSIDILKERYARGEINQAEFEERRRLLEG
jgi:putative membrane protein